MVFLFFSYLWRVDPSLPDGIVGEHIRHGLSIQAWCVVEHIGDRLCGLSFFFFLSVEGRSFPSQVSQQIRLKVPIPYCLLFKDVKVLCNSNNYY